MLWKSSTELLQRAHLQVTSLWELIVLQLHGVVTSTILEFDLSYYTIVGGKGMRRIEGRIEWGIDHMRSNKARVNGKERRQDNTQE